MQEYFGNSMNLARIKLMAYISFIGAKLATLEWLRERCGENMHRLYFNYRSPKYLLDVFNI